MQDFAAKRNALFACLDDASKELKGTALDQSNAVNPLKRSCTDSPTDKLYCRGGSYNRRTLSPDGSLSRMRGKESIFKKPELPIAKCLKPRKAPDYQVNPHKWKKYSLEDVDISDQTNTSAAFAFLKAIDDQKEQDELLPDNREEDSCTKKIEFKKSSKIKRNLKSLADGELADAEVDKPKLRGSKLLMPEYVIGQKKNKGKKKADEKKERAAGQLTLSHLDEDDAETEEG